MALVTNNISGSATNTTIGITGSLIIGNAATLPSMPGSDTTFFVSGVNGGVVAGSGVAVFGGDVLISGSLHGGSPLKIATDVGVTGSIRLSNRATTPASATGEAILFASESAGVTKLYFGSSGGAVSEVGTGGGGGGGSTVFTEESSTAAYTTSSIAIGFGAAASSKGSDVFFAVSGSNVSSNTALFSGDVVTSGSFSVKSDVSTLAIIDSFGVISGSALQAVGDLRVQGNAIVSGSSFLGDSTSDSTTVAGSLTVNGSVITATAPTTINLGNTAATVNIGQTGTGNTLNVRGSATVDNDLAVNGGDITTTAVTFNLVNTNATTVNIAGAASSTFIGAPSGRVVVPGDLEVQGTTMTVSASNLVIEDPLIGLGFLSGSIPASSTGDRGFVGAYTGGGASSVAFGYSLANSAFVATKTSADATSTTFIVSDLQPLRASKFQVSGSVAEVKGNGNTLELASSADRVILNPAAASAVAVQFAGVDFGDFVSSSGNLKFGAVPTKDLILSGAGVFLNASSGRGVDFQINGTNFLEFVDSGVDARLGAVSGKSLTISGSTVGLNSTNGIQIVRDGTPVGLITPIAATSLTIAARDGSPATPRSLVLTGSGITLGANSAAIDLFFAGTIKGSISTLGPGMRFASAGGQNLFVSGSTALILEHGASGVEFQRNSAGYVTFNSGSVGTYANIASVDASAGKALKLSGNSDILLYRGATNIANVSNIAGTEGFFPAADNTYNLGDSSLRWKNIYTGDLHLRNERGDYTLIEEEDFLSIRFNKTGKRYKFVLEPVPELDEK
jgi:hypothetical protein